MQMTGLTRGAAASLMLGIAAAVTACSAGDTPSTAAASADAALDLVSADGIRAHLEVLAGDSLEGRRAGEQGYDDAAAYVAEQFAALGLEPGGDDGWYQQVALQTYQLDTDATTFIAHRDGGDVDYEYREHYAMGADPVRAENTVRAEVVYVGYGVHAPEFGYSDYDGVDVDGKIVAGFSGAPDALPSNERAYYAGSRVKHQEAVDRGAVGLITLRSRRSVERLPWERYRKITGTRPAMTWVSATGEADRYFPQLVASAVLRSEVAEEFMAGTPIGFEAARDAAEAGRIASAPLGFEVTLGRKTKHERIESPNVIGIVRGSDPALADEYVVYTGHLDHEGRGLASDSGDDIYNGMYDNAMGIALMLEAARAFAAHPPRRSVMFIALTAEERGLLGSDYFAHYPTVPIDAIVANVNLDMPLFLYPVADLVAFGSQHSSLEGPTAAAAAAEGFELTPDPLPEENLFRRSDQWSFVRQGVPSIYLISGFNSTDPSIDGEAMFREHLAEHYHKPTDDMSRPIDWDSAVRFTRAKARIGYAVGNADARPTWNEDDFFGEKFARR